MDAKNGALGDLQQLSAELGRLAVLGATGAPEERQPVQGEELLRLLRLKEQVKQQLLELRNMTESSDEALPDLYSEEKLFETAKALEKEIKKIKVSYQNKSLVLQRVQLSHALLSKMQENISESKLIRDNIKHILLLSASILKSQQETKDLEEKINEVRKNRLQLKELGCEMMVQAQAMKASWKSELKEIESEKIKKTCQFLEKEIKMTTVVQNVFQNLILGSHVNWAQEPHLKSIVLKLEKNANSF